MNPWPVVVADLRALRWVAWVTPLLIAIAVAVGIAISAQETALRRSSAKAADDFDLLIGAPASNTQLVLTTIYLQPAAIPLIGTTAAFAGRWGRLAPSEGRLFSREGEAVVGKDVRLAIGEAFTPSHGLPARRGAADTQREDEA